MQISDKRVWRCRVCKQDVTPRCPTCKVVIGQSEAEIGMCNTCRRALPENLANCPHCSTEKSLIFSPATGYPKGLRGMLLSSTKSGQVLIGLIQVIGLFLIIQSFGNLNILPSDLEAKDSFPIGFIGIVLLFGSLNWAGVQCLASALSLCNFGNGAVLKITSVFAGLQVVNHIYTIFNLDPMSANSIMPFFIGMSVGQVVIFVFNISLGLQLMKR